jgi:2-dehydro-3-deoxy-D-arabinonate dehydratase
MRIGQIDHNGRATAAIFEAGGARVLAGFTLMEVILRAESGGGTLEEVAQKLARRDPAPAQPVIPLTPPEVWGCGCTYESSASFRDAEQGTRDGFYAAVFKGERPEVFFKGTARHCVGPRQAIGIRPDSKFTAPEPELAVVLGSKGRILGYTLANDVSAWDIERENPLYLAQSKIYTASCALGPVIVTPDELGDPKNLNMTCSVTRGGNKIFEGSVSTSKLGRSIDTLIEFLLRANPAPAGTVLMTGTGIIATHEAALAAGDVVSIGVAEIGELVNPVAAW